MDPGEEKAIPAVERVSQATLLTVTWVVTGVSMMLLTTRLAIRKKALSKLLVDDYLVILAWLLLLATAIIWQVKASNLYWMYDVQEGRRLPTPDFVPTYGTFLPCVLVWHVLFYTSLWAVKFSFLLFFRKLGTKVNESKVWWWLVFTITLCGWIACIGQMDYECSLSDIEFIMAECEKKKHVHYDYVTLCSGMAIDVVTDLFILTIPFRILWNVKIPMKQKAVLLGVFSLTIILIIVSVIRVVLVSGPNGQSQVASIEWMYLWSNVEAGTAIVIASIASFRQLFVFNTKKHTQKMEGRHWRFPKRFGFGRLWSQPNPRTAPSYEYVQASDCPPDEGSTQQVIPLRSVHVKQSFEISSSRFTPGGYAQVDHQYRGYELV